MKFENMVVKHAMRFRFFFFLNLMDFLKFSTSHHPYNALNNMEKAVVRMTSQFGTSSRIGVLWCRRRLQCCDQNFSKKQCCWLTLAASMKFSENDISQNVQKSGTIGL